MTRIDISRFVNAHGKTPRGYGCWAFETEPGAVILRFTGTFTEAKTAARTVGRLNDLGVLFVAS
jgi:hypothetical protein